MNSKQKLEQVLEYLVNNESEKASELLKSYVIETAAEIHQTIVESEEEIEEMEREVPHNDMGDDLADEIDANKDEIKSEEMMGEDEDEDELGMDDGAEEIHADLEGGEGEDLMDLDDVKDEVEATKSEVEELTDKFSELEAAFDKIKNTEEVEHDEDFDDDGVIGADAPAGDEMSDAPAEEHGEEDEAPMGEAKEDEEDDDKETIEEAMELTPVKADMKDKTAKAASPVVANKGAGIKLGGTPVKTIDKGHKGFEKENGPKVKEVTKDTNTVKDAKSALKKVSTDMKDKAPKAGESPAMPKGKK
jgi:hypothetical protein